MPRSRLTVQQLRDRIANDIEFRLRDLGADAHTPGTGYTELCHVVAGVAHGLYGDQAWIAEQILVATCADDVLIRKAGERGVPQIAAQFATGTAPFTGSNGAAIGSEVMLQSVSGIQYRTTAAGVIAGGTASIAIVAQAPGTGSNLAAGSVLTLVNPIAGVDNAVTLIAAIAGGTDIESIDRLRARLLDNLQQPPMGGKEYDYIAWAKAASVDVSRAWVTLHTSGIGSVTVRFVAEDLVDPIPGAGLITTVTDYIALRRPAGLRSLTIAAPAAAPMNLVFTSLSTNTPEVRAAIDAELKDLIRREYVAGGTLLITHIHEAISRASGESDHVITRTTNFVYTTSQFPTVGVTTWP